MIAPQNAVPEVVEIKGKAPTDTSDPIRSTTDACLTFGHAALWPAFHAASDFIVAEERIPIAAFLPRRCMRWGLACHRV